MPHFSTNAVSNSHSFTLLHLIYRTKAWTRRTVVVMPADSASLHQGMALVCQGFFSCLSAMRHAKTSKHAHGEDSFQKPPVSQPCERYSLRQERKWGWSKWSRISSSLKSQAGHYLCPPTLAQSSQSCSPVTKQSCFKAQRGSFDTEILKRDKTRYDLQDNSYCPYDSKDDNERSTPSASNTLSYLKRAQPRINCQTEDYLRHSCTLAGYQRRGSSILALV